MLVGGTSPLMKKISLKLHKEGHRIFALTGNRNPAETCGNVFEHYRFPYENESVAEVFHSVRPDLTIVMGAFDGNFPGKNLRHESIRFTAGIQNVLMAWSALEHGRLVYLSSVEVFSGYYREPVSEQVKASPVGIRPLMLYQGEECCRYYSDQMFKDVMILRLDWLYDVPKDRREASMQILSQKCLDAFCSGNVSYRSNWVYGLTYVGDAVECLYKASVCERHKETLYHISSGEPFSEKQIAEAIEQIRGNKVKLIDNTVETPRCAYLDNSCAKEEFGFQVWITPEKMVERILSYMEHHSGRFLNESDKGAGWLRRIWYRLKRTFGAVFPFVENMICFIPFFMLNNRAVDSRFFSKIDFYLLYVLLFAVVHGQNQAIFSAVLATAGYVFRQMYGMSGLAVVTDYNTYVWIAEIFILGLVVGYMKDRLRFFQEEKRQEVDFLSEQLTDIYEINDSNLRVKEGLLSQVISYDESLGTVYEVTSQLENRGPSETLFDAIGVIRRLMHCEDVALYRVDKENYARLFAYTSQKAGSLGRSLKITDKEELMEAFSNQEVYVNRSLREDYPMMAYCIYSEDQMDLVILIWGIPFERMTIGEANKLTVVAKLIQQSVRSANRYLDALMERRQSGEVRILPADIFEQLVKTYQKARQGNLTEFTILEIITPPEKQEEAAAAVTGKIRVTDYLGNRSDGSLCVLLTNTDLAASVYVQRNFLKVGYESRVREEACV